MLVPRGFIVGSVYWAVEDYVELALMVWRA